ncbi:MAG TPA: protein kinase [Thermoanaerobaculia bacterium]|nr:protein kinase [Thermoanaerobaculia bacterium]
MTLPAGTRLGTYEILSPLGAGGMGEVYRAKDSRLGRDVAIKVLPETVAQDAERLARFEREARALAALNHPGIITIFAVEESSGTRFLAMELVEGESLDALIPSGGLSLSRFLDIATPLAEALSAAHERGIVHRDLKPGNVMVTHEGRVKVLDFGLARVEAAESDPNLTSTPTESRVNLTTAGQVFGTVAYMSPEQTRGDKVDARSDVFSLGVVLHQMLTGERPFQGANAADLVSSILRDRPAAVTDLRRDLPQHLGRIVRRCLEKEPRDRYQTSRDVYNELKELRAETVSDSPASKAPSQPSDVAAIARPAPRAPSAWKRAGLAALAAILLASAVYLATRFRPGHRASPAPEGGTGPHAIRSLAVLPLDNYSGDPGQDYFAEGMTDELTADLATISQLRVISRGSAMQFKGKNRPPTPEIAKALDVDAVVEGSVIRSGDKVRITAQLIDARADRHLWAKSFERNSRDVLALQDELASAIAQEIHVQLTPDEQSRLTRSATVNPEAYDAYLKGRYFFNRPSDENLEKAIAQFEDAIKLDPNYAPAFAGLSDAYQWAGYNEGILTASQTRPKAKDAAERAIALDNESAEAHTSLAGLKIWYEYDWAGGEAEFRKALALNPNYAFAHDQLGLTLAFQGRLDEAIAEGKRAAELDPLSPQIPADSLPAIAWQSRYSAAHEMARRGAELDPTYFFPPYMDGWVDFQAGKPGDAIPKLQKAKAMGAPAFVSALLACAYGASGDRIRAMAELEDLKKKSPGGSVTPFNLALVYIGLGDRSGAIDSLDQAYASDSEWLGWLRNDRIFDPLRSEPRFVALLKKLGFDR